MTRRGSVLPSRPFDSPPAGGSDQPIGEGHPHRTLRVVASLATAVTFLLVAIGGLVRATGSGEGCTGWPKCSPGRWFPPLEHHAIIEYSHRMTAFLDIVVVGLLAFVALRRYRGAPTVVGAGVAAVGLIVVQAILGGIVVKGGLAALLVTAHFGAAMVLVAILVYATVAAFSIGSSSPGRVDGFTILARVAATATFGLMAVGAYVRGERAGLVFPDWPLMNGRLIPALGSVPAALHFTHRTLALVVGVLVLVLALRAWNVRDRNDPARVLALISGGLFVTQALVGAANVSTRLAVPAVVAHVAVSSMLWGALVATAIFARMGSFAPRAGAHRPPAHRGSS
jgi:cytochrome c oxidase assembly protein subunit 15